MKYYGVYIVFLNAEVGDLVDKSIEAVASEKMSAADVSILSTFVAVQSAFTYAKNQSLFALRSANI